MQTENLKPGDLLVHKRECSAVLVLSIMHLHATVAYTVLEIYRGRPHIVQDEINYADPSFSFHPKNWEFIHRPAHPEGSRVAHKNHSQP